MVRPPPIDALPPELLAIVFLRVYEHFKDAYRFGQDYCRTPPQQAAQVCRRWRSIIIYTTPELWSKLDLRKGIDQPKAPLVEIWLRRSGSCPLTLILHLSCSPQVILSNTWLPILLRSARRWNTVSLIFSSNDRRTKILPISELHAASDDLTGLRSLWLSFSGTQYTNDYVLDICRMFGSSPSLKSFSLITDPKLLIHLVPSGVNWMSLTHLSLTGHIPNANFVSLCQNSNNLEDLKVSRLFSTTLDSTSTASSSRNAELKALKRLRLDAGGDGVNANDANQSHVSSPIDRLFTPTLTDLVIRQYRGRGLLEAPQSVLHLLESNPSNNLETLDFADFSDGFHTSSLVRLITQPTLASLRKLILHTGNDDLVISALRPRSGSLPQLEALSLTRVIATDGEIGIMVSERCRTYQHRRNFGSRRRRNFKAAVEFRDRSSHAKDLTILESLRRSSMGTIYF